MKHENRKRKILTDFLCIKIGPGNEGLKFKLVKICQGNT